MLISVHNACQKAMFDEMCAARIESAYSEDINPIEPDCVLMEMDTRVKVRLVGQPVRYYLCLNPGVYRPGQPEHVKFDYNSEAYPSGAFMGPGGEVPPHRYELFNAEWDCDGCRQRKEPPPYSVVARYRCWCLDRSQKGAKPRLKLIDVSPSIFERFNEWYANFADQPGGKNGPDWVIKTERRPDGLVAYSVYNVDRTPFTDEEMEYFESLRDVIKPSLMDTCLQHTDAEIKALIDAKSASNAVKAPPRGSADDRPQACEHKTVAGGSKGLVCCTCGEVLLEDRKVVPVAEVISRQGPSAMDTVEEGPRIETNCSTGDMIAEVNKAIAEKASKPLCLYPNGLYVNKYDMKMLWVYQQGNDGINMNSYHYYDFDTKACKTFDVGSWTASHLVKEEHPGLIESSMNRLRRDLHELQGSLRRYEDAMRKIEGGPDAKALGPASGQDLGSNGPPKVNVNDISSRRFDVQERTFTTPKFYSPLHTPTQCFQRNRIGDTHDEPAPPREPEPKRFYEKPARLTVTRGELRNMVDMLNRQKYLGTTKRLEIFTAEDIEALKEEITLVEEAPAGQEIRHIEKDGQALDQDGKPMEGPGYCGGYPIRQDITVLPADPLDRAMANLEEISRGMTAEQVAMMAKHVPKPPEPEGAESERGGGF